jgi:histidinol phosphatase-like PHP family hydrolase
VCRPTGTRCSRSPRGARSRSRSTVRSTGRTCTTSSAARALAKGCIFALDSDAHSNPELDFIDIAIAHARLAAIPQERIINYWTEAKLLKWARGAWDR